MNESNRQRAKLLGMPFGTANGRLRKLLLFSLIKELGRDNCFRCGNTIDDAESFSIEHKTPWRSSPTPVESFFDLGNISFSHLLCNTQHGRSLRKVWGNEDDRKRANWKKQRSDPAKYKRFLETKRKSYHRRKEVTHMTHK